MCSRRAAVGALRGVAALALTSALAVPTAVVAVAETAQKPASDPYYAPLPQETGAAGLKLMLRRLQTTGRLMQVTAHPDDEDGGMLTLESRGKGVSTLLMTLTRGEGGQNKLGSNLFDVLGVLRTLELLASDRYYGVEQRFSRVADFGYSKTPEETFQKWQGHDIALADMVRVIRTFRPDVLIARFSGTDRDGHGHHQASAILTKEAFRAAGDPKKFPEQIAEGLQPWQPKKLYIGNVCGFGAMTCDGANYTVRLNTGVKDAVLGTSYIQFAMQGLRHQLSQGSGSWTVEPGDRFTQYKLMDSVVDSPKDKDGHEQDFFDGIDTTLPGLADRLGQEVKAPWLRGELPRVERWRGELVKVQNDIANTASVADHELPDARAPLLAAKRTLHNLVVELSVREIATHEIPLLFSSPATHQFLLELRAKEDELQQAINLAAGAELRLEVVAQADSNDDGTFVVVPGQRFEATARFTSSTIVKTPKITLDLPQGWKFKAIHDAGSPKSGLSFAVTVPADTPYTRPYWHRANPETDSINEIDEARSATLPFQAPTVSGHADYITGGQSVCARAVGMEKRHDEVGTDRERPIALAPAFSVGLEPGEQVLPVNDGKEMTVKVGVSSNLTGAPGGTLKLELPAGWKSEPEQLPVNLPKRGDRQDFVFHVLPASLREGRTEVHAALDAGGKKYTEGYTLVTREDLGAAYYYQPTVQRVSIIDVKIPRDLKVGYIMGAGDEIPTVLQQIGMNVTLIPAEKLSSEDLSKYQTIVLGIRAYDTQKDVIANNKRLLDYVQAGGRLVVQYNTLGYTASAGDFNAGKFTPFPATLSRTRVSVEEAPVKILEPGNPIFHVPNEITQKDFDGWVQERGLYFMSQWDAKFTPLLESHDPGESEQKGGLLVAHYGKGTYIYTGYAFFRQLPAGVPGAVRLFVNLVSGE